MAQLQSVSLWLWLKLGYIYNVSCIQLDLVARWTDIHRLLNDQDVAQRLSEAHRHFSFFFDALSMASAFESILATIVVHLLQVRDENGTSDGSSKKSGHACRYQFPVQYKYVCGKRKI